MHIDYPISKARTHIATSAITSGWFNDVYVYRLHEIGYDSGKYTVELVDIFRYSHAVKTQSRKDMLNDALDSFTNHQVFPSRSRKLHANGDVEGRPFYTFASTEFVGVGNSMFAPGLPIAGVSGDHHRVLAIAVIGTGLSPDMVRSADAYAKSMVEDEE